MPEFVNASADDSRQRLPFARKAGFSLFVFLAMLGVIEGGIRVGAQWTDRGRLYWVHPIAGYGCRPLLDQHKKRYGSSVFRYSTDTHGFRITALPGDLRQGKRIVLLGDSYAFGWCVDDADSLGYALSRRTGRPVANISCNGYAPDTLLVLLRDYLSTQASGAPEGVSHVVLLVCENDFGDIILRRTEGRAKPYFVRNEQGYRLCAPEIGWKDYAIDHSDLVFLIDHNLQGLRQAQTSNVPYAESPQLMARILQEMKTACAEYGLALTILLFERLETPVLTAEFRAAFQSACARNGVAVTNITDAIRADATDSQSLLAVDGQHWNRQGNERVAAIIARAVQGP